MAYKRPAFGVPTFAARTACMACSAQRVTVFSANAVTGKRTPLNMTMAFSNRVDRRLTVMSSWE